LAKPKAFSASTLRNLAISAILRCWVARACGTARFGRPFNIVPHSHRFLFFERISQVLMIRLARVGARKQPHYRVVVIEKDRARNGRSIEVVGTYNPRTTPAALDLKRDRIDYWVGNGARMSERVGKLFAQPVSESAPAA
jgi:small subunit ribosomal protein S16